MLTEHQHYGRRATDLLELEGRAWKPMLIPTSSPASRLAELEQRVADLERDNRELAAFAADVAHDLRAPLQAVTGFTELLARREGARLDETSQRYVGHILSAAGAMHELVEAVMQHRQSSFGPLTPTWVAVNDLLAVVLRRLQADLDAAGATVEIDVLPTVFVDRVQLGRVFQNLIGNALRAAQPGRAPRIAVDCRRAGTSWEFAVTDNGVGVQPEDRQRIFELFQRGRADGQQTGHGMGLAICRTIVERHGGRIGVERAPAGGARFSFMIPDRYVSSS